METTQPQAKTRLRDFASHDIPPLVAILNQVFADEPTTLEKAGTLGAHLSGRQPAPAPRGRDRGWTGSRLWRVPTSVLDGPTDFYSVFVIVAPAWQHRGIGQALLATLTPFAQEHGFPKLRTSCKEDSAGTVRFLEQAGFGQIGIRFELALDLQHFDETPFLAKVERVKTAGYEVITLAEARQQDAEADLRLYEVFAATVVDVPFPGGERAEPKYENFRAMDAGCAQHPGGGHLHRPARGADGGPDHAGACCPTASASPAQPACWPRTATAASPHWSSWPRCATSRLMATRKRVRTTTPPIRRSWP